MEEQFVEKCNFCDMDLPKDSCNKGGDTLIGRDCLQKYLPKITCGEVLEQSLSCKECLEYISNFHAIYSIWNLNEQRIQIQSGGEPEKTLAHIDESSQKNTSTCRLCSRHINTQESYLINDDFHLQYRKGYIQQIIALHASFIDLKLTKDPVMCSTCFNAIQTFDAFYQMCEQTFSIKKKEMNLTCDKQTVSNIKGVGGKSTTETVTKEPETVKNATDVEKQDKAEKPQEDAICVISDDDEIIVVSQQGLKRKPMKFIKKPHVKKIRSSATSNKSQEKIPNIPSTTNIKNSLTPKDMLVGEIPKINSESKKDQYAIVEIDDSDSQDSDDESTIVRRRIIRQEKVEVEDLTRDETKTTTNDQVREDSDVLIEINMTNVQKLFQPDEAPIECVVYNTNNAATSKPSTSGTEDATTTIIDDVAETPSSSTVEKKNLETNLSDFLQFKNTNPTNPEESTDREAIITPCFEINMTSLKRMLDSDQVDKGENENDAGVQKDVANYQNPRAPQAFLSSYENFLRGGGVGQRGQVSVLQQQNIALHQNDNGNVKETYYVCFPYHSHDSLVDGRRRKIDALVFEDAQKLRSYKCNLCLASYAQESQLRGHQCWSYCRNKMAKQFSCKAFDCNYRTTKKNDMRAHVASHEVIKDFVYKCDFCEFRATQADATRKHQAQMHHKGIVHNVPKCPYCYFECNDPVIMEHHIFRRHSTSKRHVVL